MYITPYFWGCKYTNIFLFINKFIEFQCFAMLITSFSQHSEVICTSFCIFGSWATGQGRRKEIRKNFQAMKTDLKWVIVRIDGKIAAISTDYRMLADISRRLACDGKAGTSGKGRTTNPVSYQNISAETVSFEEIWRLKKEATWDDLLLFGTEFQKKVWKKLYDLTHTEDASGKNARLISYTDFAELCLNRAGVRAVAHAIGLNPVSVIIPCHLVVPKESIDRIRDIRHRAEATIFKGEDLCLGSILADTAIDFGEYASGKELKRALITLDLT